MVRGIVGSMLAYVSEMFGVPVHGTPSREPGVGSQYTGARVGSPGWGPSTREGAGGRSRMQHGHFPFFITVLLFSLNAW